MRLMTVVCGMLLIGIILMAGSCSTVPTHILYLTADGCGARNSAMQPIEELVFYPGDQVVWVNISNAAVRVAFEDDSFFGETEWSVDPGKRKIMIVQSGAFGAQDYTVSPCNTSAWPGSPKAKVGEDP